jgi:peptide/nickel transport system permease protein
MAIGAGTVTADVEATATLAPSRGRVRLPRSPKILTGLGILTFFVLLAIIGPFVRPYDPTKSFANATVPLAPSAAHWLGTTQLQQDVFSQLLVGGGSMILVALVSGVIATALSVIIGVTAGYRGGLTDDLLSVLANVFLVLPALPLLIILLGFIGTASANLILVALIISLTGWAWGARVLRAQTRRGSPARAPGGSSEARSCRT